MTSNPDTRTVFGGLDPNDPNAGVVPQWYSRLSPASGVATNFRDAVDGLETATKVPLAYLDTEDIPATAEELWEVVDKAVEQVRHTSNDPLEVLERVGVIQSGKYRALVNPDWLGSQNRAATDKGDAMWQPPTNKYVPVNPMDAYGPLIAVTRQRDHEERVFGEIREYHFGGEVHMDLFFDDVRVQVPHGPEFVLGIQTGYDFRGYVSHYAHLIAVDPNDGRVYRRLYTDAGSRRHVGPQSGKATATDDVANWWVDIFDHLEASTDALLSVVAEARDYTFDLDLIGDPERAFEANGLKGYSEVAAKRLKQMRPFASSVTTTTVSAFDLFTAAAAAIDEQFEGKDEGNAARKYTNAANRFLFRPHVAERKALEAADDHLSKQRNLTDTQRALRDDIEAALDDLGAATSQARTFRKRLRDILDAAEREDEEDDDDGDSDADPQAVSA